MYFRDMSLFVGWIRYISPTSWLLPYVLNRELSQEAIESSSITPLCRNKQVNYLSIYKLCFLLINQILSGPTSRHYSATTLSATQWYPSTLQLRLSAFSESNVWLRKCAHRDDGVLFSLFRCGLRWIHVQLRQK